MKLRARGAKAANSGKNQELFSPFHRSSLSGQTSQLVGVPFEFVELSGFQRDGTFQHV